MKDTCKTPIEDLRQQALKHYDRLSSSAHEWQSDIPRAINFWYKYQKMSFWQKIKEAFRIR